MNTKNSIQQTQARVTGAIAGVQKDLTSVAQLPLAGVVYTPTTLTALLQAYLNLVVALSGTHNQLHGLVLQERTMRVQVREVLQALFAYVTNAYGSDPNKLGDFGFTPRKKLGVESVATRAEAVVKAKATRQAKKTALAAVTTPAAPPAPPAGSSGTTTPVKGA